MTTILLTFGILILAVIGLSIGTLFSRKQISGTCSTTGEACACTPEEKKSCESFIEEPPV